VLTVKTAAEQNKMFRNVT